MLLDVTGVEVYGTGNIHSSRRLRTCMATSSLVTVCGLSWAGIHPPGVLAGRCAAVDVALADFQEGVLAQLGEVDADGRIEAGREQLLHDLVLHFVQRGQARLVLLIHTQDQEPVRDADRVGDVAPVLAEDRVGDLRHQVFSQEGARLAAVFGRRVIRVVLRQAGELLSLAGALDQVFGFLFQKRDLFLVFSGRGEKDLAEEHPLLPDELVLVLVVVLLNLGARNVDLRTNLLLYQALLHHARRASPAGSPRTASRTARESSRETCPGPLSCSLAGSPRAAW